MPRTYITLIIILLSPICASAGYYPDSINGLKEAELKSAFGKVISHHLRISSATDIWQFFHQADMNDDESVWSILDNSTAKYSADNTVPGFEPDNIIHYSHYGDSRPFKYDLSFDLHMLIPCSTDIIIAKKDFPPHKVISETYSNGLTKVGYGEISGVKINAFEPANEYKGDIARMIMYAVTCYTAYPWQGDALNIINGGEYPTLKKSAIELFMSWHRSDPVSQKEINRNELVYKIQHNRNPFVDFPDLAEYIWGNATDKQFRLTEIPDTRPEILPLKSTYNINEPKIFLSSPYIPENVVWKIDGIECTGSFLVPAQLGIGIHILEFYNDNTNGRIKILIVE